MRKRRLAGPLLYALAGVQAAQLAFLCYATWVVAAALVPGCAASRGLHALVNASWALLAAVWCATDLVQLLQPFLACCWRMLWRSLASRCCKNGLHAPHE